jgi:Domain of unknown function (DUF222)
MTSAAATCGDVLEALADVAAAQDRLAALSVDGLSAAEVLDVLEMRQKLAWADQVIDHRLLARLAELGPSELGGAAVAKVLTQRLRITGTEANQRLADAEELGPRRALTGEALPPRMPTVAAGVAEGCIGPAHVKSIREFFKHLPNHIELADLVQAEELAGAHARALSPPGLRAALNRMLLWLDPDGCFHEGDIQRRRGIDIGKQGPDGLTPFTGLLTPEAAAVLEAVLAKLAAPGMCNPDDETPCITGRPTQEQIDNDHRTPAQRNHDAWLTAGRMILASKTLGKLNGLPVTVVVSTTLRELEAGAGFGVTGGGPLLPMRDLIRMASHAFHHLAVFDDNGQALYLGRTKRIASPAQRLVLFAKERGCSAPGCTASYHRCQVHHAARDWGDGGETNVNELTLACGPDNRKVGPGGYTTRIRDDGRCEWIPPPHLDNGGPRVNNHHHPENLFAPSESEGDTPREPAGDVPREPEGDADRPDPD